MSSTNRVPLLPLLSTDKYQISSKRAKNIFDFHRLHHPLISNTIWRRKFEENNAFVKENRCLKDIELSPFEVIQEVKCISNILNQLGSPEEILKKIPPFPLITVPDYGLDHPPTHETIQTFIPFLKYITTSELHVRTSQPLDLLSQSSIDQLEPFQIDPFPFIREDVCDTFLSLRKVPDFPLNDKGSMDAVFPEKNDSLKKYLSDMKEESRLREEIVEFVLLASNEMLESLKGGINDVVKGGNDNNDGMESIELEENTASLIVHGPTDAPLKSFSTVNKVVELEQECEEPLSIKCQLIHHVSSLDIDKSSATMEDKSPDEKDLSDKEDSITNRRKSNNSSSIIPDPIILPTKTTENIVEQNDKSPLASEINEKCKSSSNEMECKIAEPSLPLDADKPNVFTEEKPSGEPVNEAAENKVFDSRYEGTTPDHSGLASLVTPGFDRQIDAKMHSTNKLSPYNHIFVNNESEGNSNRLEKAEATSIIYDANAKKDDPTHESNKFADFAEKCKSTMNQEPCSKVSLQSGKTVCGSLLDQADSNNGAMVEKGNEIEMDVSIHSDPAYVDINKHTVEDAKNQTFSISRIQNISINNIAVKSKIIRKNVKDSQVGTPRSIYFPQVQRKEVPSTSLQSPYFSSKKSSLDKETKKTSIQVPFSIKTSQATKRMRLTQLSNSPKQSPHETVHYSNSKVNPLDSCFFKKGPFTPSLEQSKEFIESATNEYSAKKNSLSLSIEEEGSKIDDSLKESSSSYVHEKESEIESLTIECPPWNTQSNYYSYSHDDVNNKTQKDEHSFSFPAEKVNDMEPNAFLKNYSYGISSPRKNVNDEDDYLQKDFCFLSEEKVDELSSTPDESLKKKELCGLKRKIKRTKVFPTLNF